MILLRHGQSEFNLRFTATRRDPGIEDARLTEYGHYQAEHAARGTGELERLVDSGQAAVAFSLYPVSVGDLMAVSDEGAVMPPKSTWFEPKLRDGLLIHVI